MTHIDLTSFPLRTPYGANLKKTSLSGASPPLLVCSSPPLHPNVERRHGRDAGTDDWCVFVLEADVVDEEELALRIVQQRSLVDIVILHDRLFPW